MYEFPGIFSLPDKELESSPYRSKCKIIQFGTFVNLPARAKLGMNIFDPSSSSDELEMTLSIFQSECN